MSKYKGIGVEIAEGSNMSGDLLRAPIYSVTPLSGARSFTFFYAKLITPLLFPAHVSPCTRRMNKTGKKTLQTASYRVMKYPHGCEDIPNFNVEATVGGYNGSLKVNGIMMQCKQVFPTRL